MPVKAGLAPEMPMLIPLLLLALVAAVLIALAARTPDDDPDWLERGKTSATWTELSAGRLDLARSGPLLVWQQQGRSMRVAFGPRDLQPRRDVVVAVDEVALVAVGNEGWAQTTVLFRVRSEVGPPLLIRRRPLGALLVDPVSGLRVRFYRRGASEVARDLERRGWPVAPSAR